MWIVLFFSINARSSYEPYGILNRGAIQELPSVGVVGYQNVFTSNHELVYRYIAADVYVYAVAPHRQDF